MWDLPEPGIEPMSPALAGGFLTSVPPGKPPTFVICVLFYDSHSFFKIKKIFLLEYSCFYNSHSDRCEVISHCDFDLHFPDDEQY